MVRDTKEPMKTLKIPRSIKILGMTWKVCKLYPSQMAQDDEGYFTWGTANFKEQKVSLNRDCNPERMTLNFCHEVVHLLADAAGMSPQKTEDIAQQLERPLASLLTDNRWITDGGNDE